MVYFLERIASHLFEKYGDRLEKQCLVFPNRRAGLYFLKYLSVQIKKPVWTPEILTINELFGSFYPFNKAENEILLFELYKVYKSLTKSNESFDEFYFWGDMLINDFDDVDKYMADASLLFRNVNDLKEIDEKFGGLTDEQAELIKRFWINFNQKKPSAEKTGFINTWSVLHPLYTEFRSALSGKGICYEGMIYRDVAERASGNSGISFRWDNVHFIGFNALNNCEKTLMSFLRKEGRARFYWDYDNCYITGNKLSSTGFFLNQNIEKYGNDMPQDWNYDTYLWDNNKKVKRKVIDTSSDNAQIKLIPELLNDFADISSENAHHTAVILADENLLLPVLSSMPEKATDVNITMGYPLKQTPVYTLICHIINLQRGVRTENGDSFFHHKDVIEILRNQLIISLVNGEEKTITDNIIAGNQLWVTAGTFKGNDLLNLIFQDVNTPALLSVYLKEILTTISTGKDNSESGRNDSLIRLTIRNEFIFRIIISINRLEKIINSQEIPILKETYFRILDKVLRLQSVPFSGEPLSGIQIMGLLETRALDFRNLIIISANEGVLPSLSAGSTFIPYSLREAFGLPTINHQESIYSYHFFRLLHRAENVTFLFNSNSDGLRTGEMSRFLIQMKYEPALRPDFMSLRFEIKTPQLLSRVLKRTREHNDQLKNQFFAGENRSVISPTAINTWLNCSMRFYYRYVCRLKETEIISAEIDPALFGTILHETMKKLYTGLKKTEVKAGILDGLKNDKNTISEIIAEVISTLFKTESSNLIGGNELIIREVIKIYVNQVLATDKTLAPFVLLNLEEVFRFEMNTELYGINQTLLIGGVVDRIDEISGVTRIVDYKTGNVAEKISSVEALFTDNRKKDYDGWLQALIYCEAYLSACPSKKVRPSIYRIRAMAGDEFNDHLSIGSAKSNETRLDDYASVREEFMTSLTETVSNIFSEEKPFIMTDDYLKCKYCPFKSLCMR